MPADLPGPGRTNATAPAEIDPPGRHVGVLQRLTTRIGVSPRLVATDQFDNLDRWDTVYGSVQLQDGMLAGEGVARYKTEALTNSHKVTCTIGNRITGVTRIAICGDKNFRRYFALEINDTGIQTRMSLIVGDGRNAVNAGNGLLGMLFNLLFSFFSLFSKDTILDETQTVTIGESGDEVAIWYDEANLMLRGYLNGDEVVQLPVPRGAVPHGKGHNWVGIAVGVDLFLGHFNAGPLFTSFKLEDVAAS